MSVIDTISLSSAKTHHVAYGCIINACFVVVDVAVVIVEVCEIHHEGRAG